LGSWNGLFDFSESEVEQLDALPGHQDVGRLEIAVDDAFGMGGIESAANLRGIF